MSMANNQQDKQTGAASVGAGASAGVVSKVRGSFHKLGKATQMTLRDAHRRLRPLPYQSGRATKNPALGMLGGRTGVSHPAYRSYNEKRDFSILEGMMKDPKTTRFNPTVVQREEEFMDMLVDISTRTSLVVKSVVLPEGIHMDDPRLRGSDVKVVNVESGVLPLGFVPELCPRMPYIADLETDLVPPDWDARSKHLDTRFQILPDALIPLAEDAADDAIIDGGKQDIAPEYYDEPTFSPYEVPEFSTPHRRVSAQVEKTAAVLHGRNPHTFTPAIPATPATPAVTA